MLKELFTIKDERLKSQNHKIGSEGFYIVFSLLFISVIAKQTFFDIPMSEYWTEFAILMIGAAYTTVRHVRNGTFSLGIGGSKASKKKTCYFMMSVIAGIVIGASIVIRNSLRYGFDAVILLFALPVVLVMALLVFMLLNSLDKSALRRAEKMAGDGENDETGT